MTQPPEETVDDILIRLEVPIPADRVVNVPHLVFSHWIPQNPDEAIVVEVSDIQLRLWFDESCWCSVTKSDPLENYSNVIVNKIFADVTVRGCSSEFVEYIKQAANAPSPPAGPYQDQIRSLGQSVYQLVVKHVNRLIQYAKTKQGQYWLRELRADLEDGLYAFNLETKAKVRIAGEWHRWYSDVNQVVKGREGGCMDDRRYLKKHSWDDVQDFVKSNRSISVVDELLAGAEWLASIGHTRAAVTELVAALEASVMQYAGNPRFDSDVVSLDPSRANLQSVPALAKRLGFTATVNLILPTILPESVISTEVFATCSEAIRTRQTVVHNTQRNVSAEKLERYISAVREVCSKLFELTVKNETD